MGMNVFNRISLSLLLGEQVAPTLITGANASTEKILPSTLSVDEHAHTATLPLYRGEFHGKSVWYIITDASDRDIAQRNHVVYSPSLAKIGTVATQHVTYKNGIPQFDGIPDFSPTRSYIASEGGFPPKTATPGSVGDAEYSPFITTSTMDGVFNAPVVAVGDGPFDVTTHANTEDRVVAIDTKAKTVTIALAQGFVNDRPVLYLSTEASDPVAAAVERATYVPKLAKANAGAAIGIGSYTAPLYIAEAAPAQWRGRLVALNQLAIVVGMLVIGDAGLDASADEAVGPSASDASSTDAPSLAE